MADVNAVSNSDEQESVALPVDRISSLPSDILNIICMKLSLVDVIRMSVLAKNWRYKWLSLSHFKLDSDNFTCVPDVRNLRYNTISLIVNKFLLHHTGTINTFSLKTSFRAHHTGICQWMYYLSLHNVEVLSLEHIGRVHLLVPSHLFSFQRLHVLSLNNFALKFQSAFEGFNSLRELSLFNVAVLEDELVFLIRTSPVLEKLTLLLVYGLRHLRIQAPRLSKLVIDTNLRDIVIMAAPFLVEVCIRDGLAEVTELNWRNVVHSLSSLVSLRTLGLPGKFVKILADDYALEEYPLRNSAVTSISLTRLRFERVETFMVCFSLMSSCPIKEIWFSVESAKGPKLFTAFLKEKQGQYVFPVLKSMTVKLLSHVGFGSTVNFVEYVCKHSPNLEILTIIKEGAGTNRTRVSQILARFRRCRPQASIRFVREEV